MREEEKEEEEVVVVVMKDEDDEGGEGEWGELLHLVEDHHQVLSFHWPSLLIGCDRKGPELLRKRQEASASSLSFHSPASAFTSRRSRAWLPARASSLPTAATRCLPALTLSTGGAAGEAEGEGRQKKQERMRAASKVGKAQEGAIGRGEGQASNGDWETGRASGRKEREEEG